MSAALIGGAVKGVASGVMDHFASSGASYEYLQQKALAEHQYDLAREQWQVENEYNSPVNQVARYKAAGLNPNLIAGGVSSGNAASAAPRYQAPNVPSGLKSQFGLFAGSAMNVLASSLGTYMDFKQRQANIDNTNADTFGKDWYNGAGRPNAGVSMTNSLDGTSQFFHSDTSPRAEEFRNRQQNLNSRTVGQGLSNTHKEVENQYLDRIFNARLDLMAAQAAMSNASAGLTGERKKWFEKEMTKNLALKQAQIENYESMVDMRPWQIGGGLFGTGVGLLKTVFGGKKSGKYIGKILGKGVYQRY